jgi:hypothetical protein
LAPCMGRIMAIRVRDLRISDELDREIRRESTARATTWSAQATELLDEALRMRRAPGVGGGQNQRQDGGYEQLTAIEPGDEAAR